MEKLYKKFLLRKTNNFCMYFNRILTETQMLYHSKHIHNKNEYIAHIDFTIQTHT